MAKSERVSFQNKQGEKLSARLTHPLDGHVCAWAIVAHCFTCSKNLRATRQIIQGLTRHGVAVLSFDFTGLGESAGDFSDTSFSSNLDDVRAAANYLAEHHESPTLLVGHSLGGAAMLHVAGSLESVRAVATIGAPYDPEHVAKMFGASVQEIQTQGEANVELAGRPFTIRKQFLDDLGAHHPKEAIASMGAALLVMHSPLDQTVSVENATKIFTAAKHPKSYVSLDKADHLLSDTEDAEYVGELIARWADRYVKSSFLEKHPTPELRDRQVVVRTGEEKYHTDILMGHHALIADEPVSVGGKDQGPTPYDLLGASLGACTSMTLRMYADRKSWPLEEVYVRLDHKKVSGDDGKKIDEFTRHIELVGDLDQEQRQRLMEIADRCPVHRTLHSEVRINTMLES